MKLPAFQFYPGDWRKDPGVQSLTFHDRGVWFEILCLLHESDERGKLLLNGRPMPDDALARLLGLDKQVLTSTLTNLLTFGVASRDEQTGALVNRRMVRDEETRKTRTECGKKGGNPILLKREVNQNPTTMVNQKSTPSSSSSSSDIDALNKAIPRSIEDVISAGGLIGLPKDECQAFYHHFEGSAWVDKNGNPVGNWQAKLASWKKQWEAGGRQGLQTKGNYGKPGQQPTRAERDASRGKIVADIQPRKL